MSASLPEIETRPLSEIQKYQEKKLHDLLSYVSIHSDFYRARFKQHGIHISEIKTLHDLEKIPVTSKDDLYHHNQEFICVPSEKIIDYVTTSGTLGDPLTFVLTDKDLDRLAYNEHISLACAGGSKNDIYQLMTTIDRRFMAGMAYFLGLKQMGAGVVRVGNGMPEFQWDTIKRLKPTIAIAVPSFLLKLIEFAEQNNIDYKNCSIKKVVCIGEAIRNEDFTYNTLGKRITDKWPLQLFSTYASTEMGAAFTECLAGKGGHHHPELLIAEFLDDNNLPVPHGEAGELTVTTLGVEGMPLIRFKTGDICKAYDEQCSCGRTTMRISPILGRKQQMIKFKGTSLYPPALYDILNTVPYIKNYIVEVYTNDIGTDEIVINIGAVNPPENFDKDLKDHFRAKLRVAPAIILETPENISKRQLPEMSRKPITFIDRRSK
ncbi:MAG: phenylacetate--CoA ligase [Bacteroidetes bacterium]|jgi:phenylacetate-CoA ligase|nr:phenylacetate--CoA ligase [Bacteroidota bacterium]MDF2450700.1 phenylacetate--CoA ligase [Bacteroidota bacterium]